MRHASSPWLALLAALFMVDPVFATALQVSFDFASIFLLDIFFDGISFQPQTLKSKWFNSHSYARSGSL